MEQRNMQQGKQGEDSQTDALEREWGVKMRKEERKRGGVDGR